MPEADKSFTIGLTMAGAVSAGAYTAGVLDFLFAALAAQDERPAEEKDLQVVLKAMSGTSAGGVCTALVVPALIDGLRPFAPGRPSLPILHRIWVEELDLLGMDGRPGLISDSDLAGPHLLSVLNSGAIEAAARRVLSDVKWTGRNYPFLARELDLFVTCTNVAGVAYRVPFSSERPDVGHLMANHAFVSHYRVTGLGTISIPSAWLENWRDGGVPLELPLKATPESPVHIDFHAEGTGWDSLRRMSIATGAFPFGFAAQPIHATGSHLGVADLAFANTACGGAWPLEISPDARPLPLGQVDLSCGVPFGFVGVDGGVCNNEPFELAHYSLRARADDLEHPWKLLQNPREPNKADRAVIMIDPFPEGPSTTMPPTVNPADLAILRVLAALKTALLNQARFKPGELVAAMDGTGRSRFLISPSRDGSHGARALASGLLGGFGGFLDKSLRAHDFALGRHNAQSFIRKHFNLSERPINLAHCLAVARLTALVRVRSCAFRAPWPTIFPSRNGLGWRLQELKNSSRPSATASPKSRLAPCVSTRAGGSVRYCYMLFGYLQVVASSPDGSRAPSPPNSSLATKSANLAAKPNAIARSGPRPKPAARCSQH